MYFTTAFIYTQVIATAFAINTPINYALAFIGDKYNFSTMKNNPAYVGHAQTPVGFYIGIQRINAMLSKYNVTVTDVYGYAENALKTLTIGTKLVSAYPNLIGSVLIGVTSQVSDATISVAPYFSSIPLNTVSSFGTSSLYLKKTEAPYFFRHLTSITKTISSLFDLASLLGYTSSNLGSRRLRLYLTLRTLV